MLWSRLSELGPGFVSFSVVVGFIVYFLPGFIAFLKRRVDRMLILSLNIIAGWTFIGWLGALIWALLGDTSPAGQNRPAKAAYSRDNNRQLTLFCGHCGVQPGPDDIHCSHCGFEIL